MKSALWTASQPLERSYRRLLIGLPIDPVTSNLQLLSHHLGSPLANLSPLMSSPLRYSDVHLRMAALCERTCVTAAWQWS